MRAGLFNRLAMIRPLDVTTSLLTTIGRLASGARVGTLGKLPARPLELYEFEACPFCRKVREALSILDLEVMVYPCPKGGPPSGRACASRVERAVPVPGGSEHRARDVRVERHRRVSVHEIRRRPRARGARRRGCSRMCRRCCPGCGASAAGAGTAARAPGTAARALIFEASPFSRIVREALSSLELGYRLHNVAQGSARREAFRARAGRMMVPYLSDPNTGVEMFESADIVAYLNETYAIDA